MAMPRGRHEGNIFRRPTRGYWEGSVSLGGRRYYVTGKTRQEVIDKLRALVFRHTQGVLSPPSRLTLGEWAREWLRQGEGRWRPSTHRRRRQVLGPVAEKLGRVRLSRLSPLHIATLLEDLRREGMGTRSLQLVWATLHTCLEDARDMGIIGDNPVTRVPRPRHEAREAQDWSLEDMRSFLRAALEDSRPLAWMLALMLMTGLRPGEALGLRWEDIDWDAEALRVRRSLTWAGSSWHIGRPKTRAGERAVALPALALEMLSRLPRGKGFVFWDKAPPTTKQVSKAMASLCQRARVPRRPAHYLRHCHASLLAASGLDVKSLQRRLGHSQASVTLDVYAHALGEMDRRAAQLLDATFGTS
jgi:integrase